PASMNKDESFYFSCVVFQAENTLFKVPTYAFPADEGIFASMFALPKGDGEPEGSSDDNPINLPPEVSASDFKSLLKACLPQSVKVIAVVNIDEWMSVLKLSTMWNLDDLREKSVSEADTGVSQLGPVEKLVLAKRYSVSRWFIEAAEDLGKRETIPTAEERARLGAETSFALLDLRERSWNYGDKHTLSGHPHYQGRRFLFGFKSAIHEIFKEDLVLDKDYKSPT
ncbi:hypothetical protein PENSPDRAFT_573314, partial [Peniophora sp. CONT]